MARNILIAVLVLVAQNLFGQVNFYPTNWYTGMKWNKVELLVRSEKADLSAVSLNYPGVKLDSIYRFANKHYIALHLTIAPDALPGIVKINMGAGRKKKAYDWPLMSRRPGNGTTFAKGVTSADLVYLIMPDRFSNGNPGNDKVAGMRDQSLRRDTVFNRHGGDLQGVLNHLDYLDDLGVTTIWLNPVLENNMPNRTEHGYAITDHYKVDPRLGGDNAYEQLVNVMHSKGMKIIQDAIYNHVGIEHFLFRDKPDTSWFHNWPKYTQTNYKDQLLFDPYAAQSEVAIMEKGWFTGQMPDWDHANPFVQNFLIQNALWCMEKFGVDGWRVDTYAYNDLEFMNRCNQALYDDFPKVTIFGETWVHGVINQSFYCENNLDIPFKSNLQATTDFQTLFYGIQAAVNDKFGWTDGVNKLYTTAAQDLVYKDPMRQVIFLDNHDISRFISIVNDDLNKYKVGLTWLMTFRGIPQLYYGNEILMKGKTQPNDGYVRLDFPGGWPGDASNKFLASGRTAEENEIFNLVKKLANFRKNSPAITTGKMMQYLPIDGLYVYFRYSGNDKVMCVMNTGEKEMTIGLEKYPEMLNKNSSLTNVVTDQKMKDNFSVKPMEILVLSVN